MNIKDQLKIYFSSPSFLLEAIGHVFGVRREKTPPYQLILREGHFQIRQYEDYLTAQTTVRAPTFKIAANRGFEILAAYIFGKNKLREEIAMTAPVLQETPQSIEMTQPVVVKKNAKTWTMSFIMPAHFDRDSVPKPTDKKIVLREVKGCLVGVIKYSGVVSDKKMATLTAQLKDWIAAKSYTTVGTARSALYDPPFTLPFLRKNEIHWDVKK